MRRTKSITALVAMAAFLFAGAGDSIALVLCQGTDGRIKVELAIGGVCAPEPEKAAKREAVPTIHDRDDHCGPCFDIPLKVGTTNKSELFLQLTKIEISAPLTTTHYTLTYDATERHRPSVVPAAAGNATLTCLRAVSLLI